MHSFQTYLGSKIPKYQKENETRAQVIRGF